MLSFAQRVPEPLTIATRPLTVATRRLNHFQGRHNISSSHLVRSKDAADSAKNKRVLSTRFLEYAVNSTSGKQGDLCRKGNRGMRLVPFLSLLTRAAPVCFENKFIDRHAHWYTCKAEKDRHLKGR